MVVASSAQAEPRWFLLLEGAVEISAASGTTAQGFENWTEILSYGQNFFLPLDAQGTPGSLEFRPLRVVKAVDGASPLIAQSLAAGEVLKTCTLTLNDSAPGPGEIYKIELDQAQLIGVSGGDDGSSGTAGTEVVSILFGRVTLSYAGGPPITIP
jgi:type VI protein secretion system component Hcp